MCYHYRSYDNAAEEDSDETPSFLNEKASADTELLTDGGDDDTASDS